MSIWNALGVRFLIFAGVFFILRFTFCGPLGSTLCGIIVALFIGPHPRKPRGAIANR